MTKLRLLKRDVFLIRFFLMRKTDDLSMRSARFLYPFSAFNLSIGQEWVAIKFPDSKEGQELASYFVELLREMAEYFSGLADKLVDAENSEEG